MSDGRDAPFEVTTQAKTAKIIEEFFWQSYPIVLQTRAMAEFGLRGLSLSADDIDKILADRRELKRLFKSSKRTYTFILSSMALKIRALKTERHIEQLQSIIEVHESRPNASIYVLPEDAVISSYVPGDYIIYDRAFVHLSVFGRIPVLWRPEEVKLYTEGFNATLSYSIPPHRIKKYIEKVIREVRKSA